MKKSILFLVIVVLLTPVQMVAQVGINTDGSNPDSSAMLDVKSTVRGLLIPRMNSQQMYLIPSPATGLMVYNTENNSIYYFNGASWVSLGLGGINWLLTGNGGTDPALNFVGTTDNQPLKFRVNNTAAGEINPIYGNVFMGWLAGSATSTGYSNVAIGSGSLKINTVGHNLVAIGDSALYSYNSTSYDDPGNTAIGSKALADDSSGIKNTAVGYKALAGNVYDKNTGIGYKALYTNQTGYANVGVGADALSSNLAGEYNTAVGTSALYMNSIGDYSTAIGHAALYYNLADNNTAVGTEALAGNTTGTGNSALGRLALAGNQTASNNTAFGYEALTYNSSADAVKNTAVGASALRANISGQMNVAVGYAALTSNQTGDGNTAIGNTALNKNVSGYNNTAVGINSLYNNLVSNNTAVGSGVLYKNNSGACNTGMGKNALEENVSGYYNTAMGANSLSNNYDGYENTAVGFEALTANSLGHHNTAVGAYALWHNWTANHMTCVGHMADASASDLDDAMALGDGAIVNANAKVRIGDTWTGVIEGQVAWSWPSDGRFKTNVNENVKGLDFIRLLRPVTYNFETLKFQEFLMKNFPDSVRRARLNEYGDRPAVNPVRQTGFIGQEVAEAARKAGYSFDGVHVPSDENDNYSVSYDAFVVPLVKAVQEQQALIESLQKDNLDLKKRLQAIEAELGRGKN